MTRPQERGSPKSCRVAQGRVTTGPVSPKVLRRPLGYKRVGKGSVRGVALYSPDLMLGGIISWSEIAELFRPRMQSSLY